MYYIILDSPRGSVLKYRRLVVLELGIHVFFILFFSGKGPFCRKFDSWKMNTQKVYWWIVLSYFVSPRKMGRSSHLGFFFGNQYNYYQSQMSPSMYQIIMFLGNIMARVAQL